MIEGLDPPTIIAVCALITVLLAVLGGVLSLVVKVSLAPVNLKQALFEDDLKELKKGQIRFEADLKELQKGQVRLEGNIVRLENKIDLLLKEKK